MGVKVAAIVRTNVPQRSLHKEFLNKFCDKLAAEFYTDIKHVTADLQTDCVMLRAGSSAAMAIVQLYHNDDRCNDDTKHQYAQRMATYLAHDVRMPEDRVLVLFHDTRSCSGR